MTAPIPPTQLPAWRNLQQKAQNPNRYDLGKLFTNNSARFSQYHLRFEDLVADFSKQQIDADVKNVLMRLAQEAGLVERINALFAGELVNVSENRPALHMLCRAPLMNLNENATPIERDIKAQRQKMAGLIDAIHKKIWRGFSGKPITDVVHIGVGGSELGPLLVIDALEEYRLDNAVNVHFVSNLDGLQLITLLRRLSPETTLFVVVSKTFTTLDTIANADTAKQWFLQQAQSDAVIKHHFIGISANIEKMTAWGIPESNQLGFWDAIGGRYSLWSTVGFSIGLSIGMQGLNELYAGAYAMDTHFCNAELENNIPVMMGMTGIWNTNFMGCQGLSVLPYDNRLRNLPAFLQQLLMESNGKCVDTDDREINYDTCPIVWGEVGSNAQHSFFQLLHQGTRKVCCDFIASVHGLNIANAGDRERAHYHQNLKLANCFAQSKALAWGKKDNVRFKYYPGNQASTTLLFNHLDARNLGMLIALYEHVTFVQASIWQINPFDQWGVELGKNLARDTLALLESTKDTATMSSTDGSVNTADAQFAMSIEQTDASVVQLDVSTDSLVRYVAQCRAVRDTSQNTTEDVPLKGVVPPSEALPS